MTLVEQIQATILKILRLFQQTGIVHDLTDAMLYIYVNSANYLTITPTNKDLNRDQTLFGFSKGICKLEFGNKQDQRDLSVEIQTLRVIHALVTRNVIMTAQRINQLEQFVKKF